MTGVPLYPLKKGQLEKEISKYGGNGIRRFQEKKFTLTFLSLTSHATMEHK